MQDLLRAWRAGRGSTEAKIGPPSPTLSRGVLKPQAVGSSKGQEEAGGEEEATEEEEGERAMRGREPRRESGRRKGQGRLRGAAAQEEEGGRTEGGGRARQQGSGSESARSGRLTSKRVKAVDAHIGS